MAGPSVRPSLWERAGGVNGVLLAAVIVALLRAGQLLVIEWMKPSVLPGVLLIWDGGWFINVATEGYPHGYTYNDQGVRVGNGFAFFPLFPALIKAFFLLGVPAKGASLFVAFVAGIGAGIGTYLLGTALWSRGVGYVLMVIVCAQPMSVVLLMGYTESVFLALVTVALIAAHQRVWWLAGLAGVAGALTRPTGMALALALLVAAVMAWRDSTVRQRVWALSAACASLAAGPLFLAWVGWRVGEWDAWFKVQTAGWGSTFDLGRSVVEFIAETLSTGTGMVEAVTAWFLVGAVVFSIVAAWQRVWPPLLTFGLLALGQVVGQAGYWHSKPRLLIPVLLLAGVPLAQALARAPRSTAIAALAVWSAFGLWFGAHMITVWPFTI